MPTYSWQCNNCKNEEDRFSFTYPPVPPVCCDKTMTRMISTSTTVIFRGEGWPSKDYTRKREDEYTFNAAKRARKLKESGQVKMEDHLSFKDVDKLNPL